MFAAFAVLLAAAQPPARCPDVLDYAGWREAPGQAWDYRWPEGEPRLVVIGASHSGDPGHPQFARIAAEFAAAKPTLAFFEGPNRGERASAEQTIRETGESGYLRFLAKAAGAKVRTLEPTPAEQFGMLVKAFPADQVLLFFVLRETVRLRDREKLSGDALDAAVAKLLAQAAQAAPGLPFTDVAGLDAAARRYWPDRDWRAAEARWIGPGADDAETGGRFIGAINRADSTNRNRHMVRIFAEAVNAGERPFVLVGRNHVPMQVAALDCALGGS